MADTKISALTARTTLAGTDQFPNLAGGANYRSPVSSIAAYLLTLADSISCKDPVYGAVGDDSTDDTAAIQAAIAAAIAQFKPLYIPKGTYKITAALDARSNGLRMFGHSREDTILKQYTANNAVLKAGKRFQHISDLWLQYNAAQTSANTSGNCLELYKAFWGTYERIYVTQGCRGVFLPQSNYDDGYTSTGNGVFSCTFNDIRVTGYALNGVHINNYGGGGTGSVWNNLYISNNYSGTRIAAAGSPLDIRIYDEMVFNQLNVEWCLLTGDPGAPDALSFESIGAVTINGLHIEQVQLTNFNAAYILVSDDCRLLVNGCCLSNSVVESGGAHALIRGGLVNGVELEGFYQHNNTVAGTFTLYNAANATAAGSSVRANKIDTALFSAIVGSEKAAPDQILRQLNGINYGTMRALLASIPAYADDAAAASGGLAVGDFYRTASAIKMRVA